MISKVRAWRFGDDVNTDLIIPGRYLSSYDPAHLAKHAMEGADKDFPGRVKKGDIIIAGSNFGCGSSREQAVIALRHAGVGAIVAKSFARIFYRNSVNLGLPVYVSESACGVIPDGATVVIDAEKGVIDAVEAGKKAPFDPMPDRLRAIVEEGGLVPHLKKISKHK